MEFYGINLLIYRKHKRKIQTVIIYSSNVQEADVSLDIGYTVITPQKVMLCEYNGNKIYQDLEVKLKGKEDLTDVDMLNLIFIPLMKHDIPKKELAIKSIEMAKTIEDTTKRQTCIGSIVAFASKYLNESDMKKIVEVFRMTDVYKMIVNDREVEIATEALKEGLGIELIAKLTKLGVDTIESLKEQLEEGTEEEN